MGVFHRETQGMKSGVICPMPLAELKQPETLPRGGELFSALRVFLHRFN